MANKVSASIAAENTYSDPIYIKPEKRFLLVLQGTWSATVTLQRAQGGVGDDTGSLTWEDVATYTANGHNLDIEPAGAFWRFGVATGDYTSGTVSGRIERSA